MRYFEVLHDYRFYGLVNLDAPLDEDLQVVQSHYLL
jgi:hypothetical protein